MNLIKSELRKLTYQRSTYALIVAAIALSILSTAFSPYALAQLSGQVSMPLSNPNNVDGIYAKALGAYILVLIIGVRFMSGEFQHHTAVATFLATPKRHRVLIVKLVVAAVVGAIVNLIATVIGMASGWFALQFYSNVAAPHAQIFIDFPLSALLTGAVLCVVGVGIGSLIRNQTIATTLALIWILLVDRIIAVIWVPVGKYLPTGLVTSLMNLQIDVSDASANITINTNDYLAPLPAALLLLAYGLVFAAASLITGLRRDIE